MHASYNNISHGISSFRPVYHARGRRTVHPPLSRLFGFHKIKFTTIFAKYNIIIYYLHTNHKRVGAVNKSKTSPWLIHTLWYTGSISVMWVSFFNGLRRDLDVNIYHGNRSLYVDKRRSASISPDGSTGVFPFFHLAQEIILWRQCGFSLAPTLPPPPTITKQFASNVPVLKVFYFHLPSYNSLKKTIIVE